MSVLLLVLSALVLIYFSIGGKTAALIMSVATLIGVAQDDWHILSFLIGGILLALALIVTLPGDLRWINSAGHCWAGFAVAYQNCLPPNRKPSTPAPLTGTANCFPANLSGTSCWMPRPLT